LRGSSAKPRLSVVKSNVNITAQLIDDEKGVTLAGLRGKRNVASGKEIGVKMGEMAKQKGVEQVVFDRGSAKYHGVVAAVADGAREAGLRF